MTTCGRLRDDGTVAVVGAGPAGLTLARLLQLRGFSVRVFERDTSPDARRQGGSLDLRPGSGQRAVREAGLGDAVDRVSRAEAKAFTMRDDQGTLQASIGADDQEDAGPEIDRADLRRLLLDYVAPGSIAWDHAVTDVVAEPDGRWRLEFRDQAPVTADLVVGADGVHSRVRRRLTDVRPRYFGVTMVAAVLRHDLWRGSALDAQLGEGSMLVVGDGRTIWVQRCDHDLVRFYFSMNVDEHWPASEDLALRDTGAVLDAVAAAYRGWSPEVMAMFTEIEDGFERWPLFVLPADHRWATRRGATILGDAAHAMPPFTGRGVNLALLDALELADALTEPDADLVTAVQAFEERMQERTRAETGECLDRGREIYRTEIDFSPA